MVKTISLENNQKPTDKDDQNNFTCKTIKKPLIKTITSVSLIKQSETH